MANFVERWVDEQARLTRPDKIHWVEGTREEVERLVELGISREKTGPHQTFRRLNPSAFPGSYLHRSHPNDVARTEQLTFVCLPTKEDTGPNNNWMEPGEAKRMVRGLFDGCMKGRILYVIPYMMGHPDSPYAKPCIQITDSIYVAVSMYIMTRVGPEAIRRIGGEENFVRGLHSIGELDPAKRFILHFPHERLVLSIGSGYGGNALLGKKCFSLRIASFLGLQEGWLAEHMIIIGLEEPSGEITYLLGAFPSACGKTNLAMIEPVFPGCKVHTLGDDIAWINVGPDGRLYAINPESGFFGVAPGTSPKTNPNMMATLKGQRWYPTLFTNTALDADTNNPWWEGLSDEPPANLLDWQGNPWRAGKPAAHPNSRFTVSVYNCPNLSKEYNNPKGVPISGIIFGGRRSNTIPLVCESFDWEHGVFRASTNASETTTAAAGAVGVVRRDPMAMIPFTGYNMADYFNHWLKVGTRLADPPKIFMVNWFRKNDRNGFLWPGYRENSRVLKWMVDRIHGRVGARETAIGLLPHLHELELGGVELPHGRLEELFALKRDEWEKETAQTERFYSRFGARIPPELREHLRRLKASVAAM